MSRCALNENPFERSTRWRVLLRGVSTKTMEGCVAVTHSDWFEFLARQPQREEVNFWSPADYYVFQGTPGAPFFFKLKRFCDHVIFDIRGEGTSLDE